MPSNGPVTWHDFNALSQRVTRLEEKHAAEAASAAGRKDRTWAIVTLILGGLVCPVVVTTVLTIIHLATH